MELRYFHVDAFTDRPFAGNPAAVVPLDAWLPDATMQAIAAELNLSETAFFAPEPGAAADDARTIRWFTPAVEVDLCGHATLASACVLMTVVEPTRTQVRFGSRSGPLAVRRDGDRFVLDFPARPPQPCTDDALVTRLRGALGRVPSQVLRSRDLIAVFEVKRSDTLRELTLINPQGDFEITLETGDL